MIGKVAPSGRGFKGVINYLMLGNKDEPDPHRVAWHETRNLLVHDPKLVPRVMRATATQSDRCQKPVYHFVLSWHRDENPSDDVMRLVGDTTLADLDLAEHQALLLAHTDTEHRHLHIVVNRVHPDTGRAWSNSQDYARIERSLRRQAEAMGMPYVPGRHNDPERFGGTPKRVRDAELQAAVRNGRPVPRDRWDKEQISARKAGLSMIFDGARSWDQLSRMLANEGLSLERKGQGVVIGDASGFMKLSDLGKDVRLGFLEERFAERFDTYLNRTSEIPRVAVPDDDNAGPAKLIRPGAQPKTEAQTRQREEMRQQRIAERARQLAERSEKRAANADAQDDAPAVALAQPKPEPAKPPAPPPPIAPATGGDRADAFAALRDARAGTDIVRALSKWGLANEKDIERAAQDTARAQDQLGEHLSLGERLDNDLRAVLSPKKPTVDEKKAVEEQRKKQKAEAERKAKERAAEQLRRLQKRNKDDGRER